MSKSRVDFPVISIGFPSHLDWTVPSSSKVNNAAYGFCRPKLKVDPKQKLQIFRTLTWRKCTIEGHTLIYVVHMVGTSNLLKWPWIENTKFHLFCQVLWRYSAALMNGQTNDHPLCTSHWANTWSSKVHRLASQVVTFWSTEHTSGYVSYSFDMWGKSFYNFILSKLYYIYRQYHVVWSKIIKYYVILN